MKERIKNIAGLVYSHLELISWILILLILMLPMSAQQHFTLCPFQNLGLENCPGCGLGRSCNLALHGHFIDSIIMHPLGIFAIIVIVFRIFALTINKFNLKKTKVS